MCFLHLFTYFYHKSHPEALAHDQACAIALAQVPVHKAPPSLRQAAAESGVERKGNHSPIITLCYPSGGSILLMEKKKEDICLGHVEKHLSGYFS